jgi:hypothetical protein
LQLAIHELIDDQWAVGRAEEFAQLDLSDWRITGAEIRRTFPEDVVLYWRTLRQGSAEFSDPLLLLHQVDLRQAKLLASGEIVGRLVGEPCVLHNPSLKPLPEV